MSQPVQLSPAIIDNVAVAARFDLLMQNGQTPQLAVYQGRLFIAYQKSHTYLEQITQLFLLVMRTIFYNRSISYQSGDIEPLLNEVSQYHQQKVIDKQNEKLKSLNTQIEKAQAEIKSLEQLKAQSSTNLENASKAGDTEEEALKSEVDRLNRLVAGVEDTKFKYSKMVKLIGDLMPFLLVVDSVMSELKILKTLEDLGFERLDRSGFNPNFFMTQQLIQTMPTNPSGLNNILGGFAKALGQPQLLDDPHEEMRKLDEDLKRGEINDEVYVAFKTILHQIYPELNGSSSGSSSTTSARLNGPDPKGKGKAPDSFIDDLD